MMLATEIMTVLILVTFVWLLRSFTRNVLNQMLACLLLVASVIAPWGPGSVNSLLFFGQASFYACYLITMFVVFGDYTRAMKSRKKRLVPWTLSLLLCFATGMQSLRQTVVMILPILAYELFLVLRRVCKHEAVWGTEDRSRLIRVSSYAVANMAGILCIEWMDIPQAAIYGGMKGNSVEELPQRIQAAWVAIQEITNIDYILQDDYSRGIALAVVYLLVIVCLAAVLWLSRIHKEENGLEMCWLLCLIGIMGVLLATVLLDITVRSIYIFMWFPLVAFSGLIILERAQNWIKYGIIVVTCMLAVLCLSCSYKPYVEIAMNSDMTDAERMSQWAVENGYSYVYGEYWGTAPQIVVYSEGNLEAGCWHTAKNVFKVEMCNTPQDIYGEEENRKAVYVFSSVDEEAGIRAAGEQDVILEKIAEFGKYKAYTSPVQLMKTVEP